MQTSDAKLPMIEEPGEINLKIDGNETELCFPFPDP